jgi:hypothetical protein
MITMTRRVPGRRGLAVTGLLLAVTMTAAGCASGPRAPDRASAAAARRPAAALRCRASVTSRHPRRAGRVSVRLRTAANARITLTTRYRGASRQRAADAGPAGRRIFRYRLADYARGRVAVAVRVSLGDRRGRCATWFRVRRATRPAPSPSPASSPPAPAPPPTSAPAPAPTGASSAWCTATASVYYAPDDENNVYVHSNQPYTDATASADGHSWSYETNGSGYALIYLNGPPPGAQITVTVGGATCSTSD